MKHLFLASACALVMPAAVLAQTADAPAGSAALTVNTPNASPAPVPATAGQGAVSDAVAPGTADASDPNDGEIIITATRRSQALSNVPIAVSAVSQESLQNSGANDIRALNQLAPSLLVSSTGNEANGSARIRGIGTVGDNPGLESSVAVFIDGVYRSRTGSGLNELGEIERIEVLRGPQGTLFGRNASAGLINIITAKPSFDFGANGEATYGNYNQIRLQGGVTGPIIAEKLAARIDGVFVKRDGFYKDVTGGNGRVNDRDRYFVRGQLLFTPTDDISLRLIGDYTNRNEECCAAVYTSTRETFDPTGGAQNATSPGFNTDRAVATANTNRIVDILGRLGNVFPTPGDPYSRQIAVTPGRSFRNTTTDWGGSGQLDWDLGDVTLTSITAYRQYKAGGAADIDYTNLDLTYRADDGNAFRRFKTFTQEVRLQGSLFDDRLDWLVGGFYSREKLKVVDNARFGTQYGQFAACRVVSGLQEATGIPYQALINTANPGCLSATATAVLNGGFGAAAPLIAGGLQRLSTLNDLGDQRAVYNQDSENYAFFTHNIFKVTDRLSLTVGARYTHEQKDFDANFVNNNTVCPTQQSSLGPLLGNPALAALAGGIITLSCTGNSSSALNALNLNDSFKESQWTGTAVLSWKPIDPLLVYASYAKGYKAGGYNLDRSDLGSALFPRSNANAANLQFEPEKVDAYELGAKLKLRGFTLNAAVFRQEFKSFQLNTFNGTVFVVQNINSCGDSLNGLDQDSSATTGACSGKVKPGVISQGVELEAVLSPTPNVQVSAGYTYSDTFYKKNLVGSTSGEALDPALFLLPGRQLSNAPKHTVTTSAAFTPDIGSSGLSGLFYVDSRTTSKYNTGSDLFPEKEQASFTTVNARIGIRGADQKWALELWGQNIFNVNYKQVAFNTPFQGAGSSAQTAAFGTVANQLFSSFLAEPRTYGVTGRFRF
ncbi:TonB-dependent receptor [Glacieibacterium frigidum]|uniref:TonB-dependent receptor n=1 Tax=Glacieibacterium frigidum TaxID=2593303 RepID=A0A552U7E8_9SPHN|nr:TonB-dependent receptor [Glacieibacterium frigidum]TRW14140.1 TonB-dependent receptor [Glacieibacterium frigidum]